MTLESQLTEKQLFDQLISSVVHSVWVALGKIKNPIADKIERDLFQASMSIDMLDMLYKRMAGNLSESENKYLAHILSELQMNYLEEKNKGEQEPSEAEEKKESADAAQDEAKPPAEEEKKKEKDS